MKKLSKVTAEREGSGSEKKRSREAEQPARERKQGGETSLVFRKRGRPLIGQGLLITTEMKDS